MTTNQVLDEGEPVKCYKLINTYKVSFKTKPTPDVLLPAAIQMSYDHGLEKSYTISEFVEAVYAENITGGPFEVYPHLFCEGVFSQNHISALLEKSYKTLPEAIESITKRFEQK